MNQKFLIIVLVLMLLLGCVLYLKRFGVQKDVDFLTKPHLINNIDENLVYAGIRHASLNSQELPYTINGGIVPHHLLANSIIAKFFATIAFQKPKTIIILGPNHTEAGGYNVLTSDKSWQTQFGLVRVDNEIVQSLVVTNASQIDNTVLANDQSVVSLLPFVAHYLPNAFVVPLLLSGHMKEFEAEKIASLLEPFLNKNSILIASVDFSHYLTSKVAEINDQKTKNIMDRFNYKELFALNSDFLDSPPSIGVLLKVMQNKNSTNNHVLDYANSGGLLKNEFIGSTSYFSIVYY